MAIFISGGLGHVGSWVAYILAKQGKKVIIYDAAVDQLNHMGLDYLQEVRDNLILEAGDVLDFQTTVEVMNRHRNQIEGIIHTVALLASAQFDDRPYRNININTFGTLNMLEAARIFGIKKFVYTSSGAVYGDTQGILTEDTPYKATDLYGATKISGELFSLQYGDTFGIDVRCARLYFVYGPGKTPSRMYNLYQGLFGPLEGVFNYTTSSGAGMAADFSHVWDAAQGVSKIFQQGTVNNRVFNISSGVALQMSEIVQYVKELLGKDTGVILGQGIGIKRGAPLDISRARQEVGYEPKFIDIRDGIRDYREWLIKNGIAKA